MRRVVCSRNGPRTVGPALPFFENCSGWDDETRPTVTMLSPGSSCAAAQRVRPVGATSRPVISAAPQRGRCPMTVHSGLLRMDTPGGGHIVDITPGVESVLRAAEVERGLVSVFATGSTVAITTMEYEPGGVHDLQALLDSADPAGR